jgi:hypothetical protein
MKMNVIDLLKEDHDYVKKAFHAFETDDKTGRGW